MSIKIMSEVWEHASVTQGTLLVLLALADSADEKTRQCWPAVSSLASKARLSDRQVQRCISELVEAGMVEVQPNAGRSGSNLFRVSEVTKWRGDKMSGGDTHVTGGVTPTSPGGVTPTSPKPSLITVNEPSIGREGLFDALDEDKPKSDGFDEFWKVYPTKAGKEDAQKAWRKAITVAPPATIIAAAARYAEWLNSGGPSEFRPQVKFAQGWLNGKRWEDPAIAPAPTDRRARFQPPSHEEVFR